MTDAQNATTDEAQPSSTPQSSPKSFADFGVRQDISDALAAVGIVSPFPIQEMTLPVALAGHDIIGQAKPVPVKPSGSVSPRFSVWWAVTTISGVHCRSRGHLRHLSWYPPASLQFRWVTI